MRTTSKSPLCFWTSANVWPWLLCESFFVSIRYDAVFWRGLLIWSHTLVRRSRCAKGDHRLSPKSLPRAGHSLIDSWQKPSLELRFNILIRLSVFWNLNVAFRVTFFPSIPNMHHKASYRRQLCLNTNISVKFIDKVTKTTELAPPRKVYPLAHLYRVRRGPSTHLGWPTSSPPYLSFLPLLPPPVRLSCSVCRAALAGRDRACASSDCAVHASKKKKKKKSWAGGGRCGSVLYYDCTFATLYPTQTAWVVGRLASVWIKTTLRECPIVGGWFSRRGVGGTMCWSVETSLKISQRRVVRSRDPAEEDACALCGLVSRTRVPEPSWGKSKTRINTWRVWGFFWGVGGFGWIWMPWEGPGDALRNGSCQILDIGTGISESVGPEPNSGWRGIDSDSHLGHLLSLFFWSSFSFRIPCVRRGCLIC